MTLRPLLAAGALALAAACSGPQVRLAVPDVAPTQKLRTAYASLEIRDVSLPDYAAGEEIYIEEADGRLVEGKGLLWADDPGRAMTLQLSRDLGRITGARVAPEPWPFEDPADARVDVRVDAMVASVRGQFRLTGQYFVAPYDGGAGNRARGFEVAVPLPPKPVPAQIAAARAQAVAQLSLQIARDGLR